MRERATGIVLRGNMIMFIETLLNGAMRRVFVGGGVEPGETPDEAMLRELWEEALVEGRILYGPVLLQTDRHREQVFVLEIADGQEPWLGQDPELPANEQDIKGILWYDIYADHAAFNDIDKDYARTVINHAAQNGVRATWLETLEKII